MIAFVRPRTYRPAYAGLPNKFENLGVTGRDPFDLAPVAAVHHHRQLEHFIEQMQVQLAGAGESPEVVQHFLDSALHSWIRVLLAQRRMAADVAWRQGVVLFTALGLLPQTLVHAVDDHRQLEFVEGPLDAQHHAVLGIGRIVEAVLVCQQHVFKTAEPNQAGPVLVVANQPRELARRDQAGLAGHDRFQQPVQVLATVLRTAGPTAVLVEQDDPRLRPTQPGDVLDHRLLALPSFPVLADLAGAALTQIDVGRALQVVRLNEGVRHRILTPFWEDLWDRGRVPSAVDESWVVCSPIRETSVISR